MDCIAQLRQRTVIEQLLQDILGPNTRPCIAIGFLNLCLVEGCDSCQCSHMSNTPLHNVHMLKVLVWTQ